VDTLQDLDAPTYTMVAEVLASLVAEGGAGSAKNFLGQRTGPARELELVLALYKKHALHWGETAQILAQLTDYEVPSLNQIETVPISRQKFGRFRVSLSRGWFGIRSLPTPLL
jgi:hypothetical protein